MEATRRRDRTPAAILLLLLAAALVAWLLAGDREDSASSGGDGREVADAPDAPPSVPSLGGVASGTTESRPGDEPPPDDPSIGIVRARVERVGAVGPEPPIRVQVAGGAIDRVVPDGPLEVRYPRGKDAPTLRISAPGFRTRRWTLASRVVDLGDVSLLRSPTYGGRVWRDRPGGTPAIGAVVHAHRDDGTLLASSSATGEDGRYRLSLDDAVALSEEDGWLPRLHLRVEWERTPHGPYDALATGLSGAHDLVLLEPATLRFIHAADRTPVASARVHLARRGASPTAARIAVHSGTTDEDGRVTFPRPTWTGDLVVSLSLAGTWVDFFRRVTPRWSDEEIAVDARSIGDVPIRVEREDGSPASGAIVAVRVRWEGIRVPQEVGWRGTSGADGSLSWRVHLPARDAYLVPLHWSVLLPGAKTPESGPFRAETLPAFGPLPRIRLGERRSQTQRIVVLEEPSGMPVMPSRAFLRLFHGTKLVAEGEVAFSTAFEESPLGPVHEMRLPPAVVRALDERLMFDAPVLHLEVDGRLPRTVPLRIRDFTEGLRRDVLLVARVPENGRRATVRVVSSRGTPVAGAAVALLPTDGHDGLFGLVRATAGPDGEAAFGDLEHRAYAVHAFDPATGSAGTGAVAGDRGAVSLRGPDRVRSLRVSLDGPGRAAWSTLTLESVPPGALPSVTVTSRGRDIEVPPLALDAYRARIDAGTKDDGTPTHRLVVDAGELRRTQRLRLPPVER